MSRSAGRILTAFVLFLTLALAGGSAGEARQPDSNFARAEALVVALFPDLVAEQPRVRLEATVGFAQPWNLANPVKVSVEREDGDRDRPLLKAVMLFEREDYDRVSFDGSLIPTDVMARIDQRARQATRWDLDEAAALLASEHAKFGPHDEAAFARLIDLDRWSGAFGRVTLADIQFVWRLPFDDVSPGKAAFAPRWVVEVHGLSGRGERRCYSISFEPVNGRPIAVHGNSC